MMRLSLVRCLRTELRRTITLGTLLLASGGHFAAAQEGSVTGVLVANGTEVQLPYVYLWAEGEGFYEPDDPTWKLLFVGRPLEPRELGDPIWDAAWVEIGLTETSEFGEEPELQVYTQSIRFSADAGGNISGGSYPEFDIDGLGGDTVSGRIYHPEAQEFFDDTYQFDLTFEVQPSDPNAPIGEMLPDGGGEPGAAYLAWVAAVHSGEVEQLKRIVPPEMAEQLDAATPEEAREEIEFMQSMTPTDVRILSGSSDGETAILDAEGMLDGETVTFEVTLQRMGDFWLTTNVSM